MLAQHSLVWLLLLDEALIRLSVLQIGDDGCAGSTSNVNDYGGTYGLALDVGRDCSLLCLTALDTA